MTFKTFSKAIVSKKFLKVKFFELNKIVHLEVSLNSKILK